ncbi:MAG: CTP-dependent riboflavin kinase [Nanoarchaeota archaeon]|nr:CTP-dependent riboflavin kinase [Nanoarchaeota archaeon]MBU1004194.1 CTP-dependent riboflavin kinase [Nanoarchaeota archaeon]MBU1945354.1 CTP-dependent riboflavin kinase [Nanoarchaeota archaeon]
MYDYLELLLFIAKKQGLFGSLKTSTLKISKELNIPQQTISRKLREMEDIKLIKRTANPAGLTISLDNKGRELLQKTYRQLNSIFKAKKTSITGTLKKGFGEGAYYVSQKEYQNRFKEKLGFEAYPGTLNLSINKEELLLFISNSEPVKIEGFQTKERTFGSLTCYKVKIKNIDAAIVVPERTRHEESMIELIAPVNLRDKLNLKENDKVKLS